VKPGLISKPRFTVRYEPMHDDCTHGIQVSARTAFKSQHARHSSLSTLFQHSSAGILTLIYITVKFDTAFGGKFHNTIANYFHLSMEAIFLLHVPYNPFLKFIQCFVRCRTKLLVNVSRISLEPNKQGGLR
jgi:hypothetical protein